VGDGKRPHPPKLPGGSGCADQRRREPRNR
jgi:hypothetical protein